MAVAVLMVVLICLLTAWGVFGDRLLARRRADRAAAPLPRPVAPRPVTPPKVTPRPVEPQPVAPPPAAPPVEPPKEAPPEAEADDEPLPEPVPEPVPEPAPAAAVERPAPKLPAQAWTHLSTPWERASAMAVPVDEPAVMPPPAVEAFETVEEPAAAPLTVVVSGTTRSGVDASSVHGEVFEAARFDGNHLVVLGNDNETTVRVTYEVRAVHLDFKELSKALNGPAREALQALCENPADDDANRAFRRALKVTDEPGPEVTGEVTTTVTDGPLFVDCTVVAVHDNADHSVKQVHELGKLEIDLAEALHDDSDLTRALAEHLVDPDAKSMRNSFFREVKAAVDFHDLPLDVTGDPVKLNELGGRLVVAGPAVSAVGEGNVTKVTERLRIGKVTEGALRRIDDVVAPAEQEGAVDKLDAKALRDLRDQTIREVDEDVVRDLGQKAVRELADEVVKDLADKVTEELDAKALRELREAAVDEVTERAVRELRIDEPVAPWKDGPAKGFW